MPLTYKDSSYKSMRIVNGYPVENIELHEKMNDTMKTIQGHVNNIPVNIQKQLSKTKKNGKKKNGKKKRQSAKRIIRSSTRFSQT